MHVLYLNLAWLNYGLDISNITMHIEVVHSMNAYVSSRFSMRSCKSKILNEF